MTKMINLKRARTEKKELEHVSRVFNNVYAEWESSNREIPFQQFLSEHTILVSDKIYNLVLQSIKPYAKNFNPRTPEEFTDHLINSLLYAALNDNWIIHSVLVECGKSEQQAREIVSKIAEVTE